MATTIAQYFTDELEDWNQYLAYYKEEIEGFDQKLLDVIRRNSIVEIAERVGVHQRRLSQVSDKFENLQIKIQQQEAELKRDNELVENVLINDQIEIHQVELRREMQSVEKEYIDAKFDCSHFLSETLKK